MFDTYALRLLRDDDDFAAFYKPPGRETISESGDADAVKGAAALLSGAILFPVHRLDRDTSGVLLMARNPIAKKTLENLFRTRQIEKEYRAVCLGVPANRTGAINRKLSRWSGGRRPVKVVKGGGGLEAMTEYRLLAENRTCLAGADLSLVAFQPHQGRTHQIRVHAAALGYPVLGDDQYGDRQANKWARDAFGLSRQALHAWRLRFPWNGREVEISCPFPDDLAVVAKTAFPAFRE